MSRPDGAADNNNSDRRQMMVDPIPLRIRNGAPNIVGKIKTVRPVCPVPKPGRCLICAGRKICHYM